MADPEVVAQIAAEPEEGEWRPEQREWNLTNELLARVLDRLADVAQSVLSTIPVDKGKARPKYKVDNFPRPESAIQKARDELAREIGWSLIKQFFPEGGAR